MRMPDEMLGSVVFLCVVDGHNVSYGGTAFFVSFDGGGGRSILYLVTARHNLNFAQQLPGRLHVRFNTAEGSTLVDLARVGTPIEAEDPGSDVAVIPVGELPADTEAIHLPIETICATADFIRSEGIGVGNEIYAAGLFALRWGQERNLPIIRSGVIASMPLELQPDDRSGALYSAYLVELHSLGGLSGSPVFVLANPRLQRIEPAGGFEIDQPLKLLGMIRGHWNYEPQDAPMDFRDVRERDEDVKAEPQAQRDIHTGIAIVTPVTEILALLNREDLSRDRRQALMRG